MHKHTQICTRLNKIKQAQIQAQSIQAKCGSCPGTHAFSHDFHLPTENSSDRKTTPAHKELKTCRIFEHIPTQIGPPMFRESKAQGKKISMCMHSRMLLGKRKPGKHMET